MPETGFHGVRVLALESRRAVEIATLIRNAGGEPLVAPAMREAPLHARSGEPPEGSSHPEALAFAAALSRGEFDWVIFLTGIGVRALAAAVADRDGFLADLRRTRVAVRGSKPAAVLREFQVPVAVAAAEPSTWRELIVALDTAPGAVLAGARVAVQEYGAANPELIAALTERGARVRSVPVYRWALPEDERPLRDAARALAEGRVEVALFTNAVQVMFLFQVAEREGGADALARGLRSTVIASIGPTTSAELQRRGCPPDLEPSHPKMGLLVRETAAAAAKLLEAKRLAKRPR
ncbi:MAG TPA: uroporphyrinogen-III synthase [Terriglobales bacterium]|nr:uroporphyrinogen-III synthase [Terriglobales bacterium]